MGIHLGLNRLALVLSVLLCAVPSWNSALGNRGELLAPLSSDQLARYRKQASCNTTLEPLYLDLAKTSRDPGTGLRDSIAFQNAAEIQYHQSLISTLLAKHQQTLALSEVKTLKIMAANAKNLELDTGDFAVDLAQGGIVRVGQSKPVQQRRKLAIGILESLPAFFSMAEVQGSRAAKQWASDYLGDLYVPIALDAGANSDGMTSVLFALRTLPFVIRLKSNSEETWIDPFQSSLGPIRLHGGDVVEASIWAATQDRGREKPLLNLVMVHAKSKRARSTANGTPINDPFSRTLRSAQLEHISQVVERSQALGIPTIVMGDFNGSIHEDAEIKPLFERNRLLDPLDWTENADGSHGLKGLARATHSTFFYPSSAPPAGFVGPPFLRQEYQQIDATLVTPDLRGLIHDAGILRWKDWQGQELPLPRDFEERNLRPTDHDPVWVQLWMSPILAPVIRPVPEERI